MSASEALSRESSDDDDDGIMGASDDDERILGAPAAPALPPRRATPARTRGVYWSWIMSDPIEPRPACADDFSAVPNEPTTRMLIGLASCEWRYAEPDDLLRAEHARMQTPAVKRSRAAAPWVSSASVYENMDVYRTGASAGGLA